MGELTKKQHSKINRAIRALNDVMDELRIEYPEANYYIEDSSHFNVMCGPSHTPDSQMDSLQENVMQSFMLWHSGGGAW